MWPNPEESVVYENYKLILEAAIGRGSRKLRTLRILKLL